MSTDLVKLADLTLIAYLDEAGQISDQFDGKVGIYAIFDQDKILQYVGYSRDISLSLQQHLVRRSHQCYWFKVQTIERPSRTILEEIRTAWIAENGTIPIGNDAEAALWNQPIDAKLKMSAEEQIAYNSADDLGKVKTLKQVARRVETEVLAQLESRGAKLAVRFDPKLKEEGLLNLK